MVPSDVIPLVDASGRACFTVWLRRLIHTGNVLYARPYSIAERPAAVLYSMAPSLNRMRALSRPFRPHSFVISSAVSVGR